MIFCASFALCACDFDTSDSNPTNTIEFSNDVITVELNNSYNLDELNNLIIDATYSQCGLSYEVSDSSIATIVDNILYPKQVGTVTLTVNADIQRLVLSDSYQLVIEDHSVRSLGVEQESMTINIPNDFANASYHYTNKLIIDSEEDNHTVRVYYKSNNDTDWSNQSNLISYDYMTGDIEIIGRDSSVSDVAIKIDILQTSNSVISTTFVVHFEYNTYTTSLNVSTDKIYSIVGVENTVEVSFDKGTTILPTLTSSSGVNVTMVAQEDGKQTYKIVPTSEGSFDIIAKVDTQDSVIEKTIKLYARGRVKLSNMSLQYIDAIYESKPYSLTFYSNKLLDQNKISIFDHWTIDTSTSTNDIGVFDQYYQVDDKYCYVYNCTFENFGNHSIEVQYRDEFGDYSNLISLQNDYVVYQETTDINTMIYNQSNILVDTNAITLTIIDDSCDEFIQSAINDGLNLSCYIIAKPNVTMPYGSVSYTIVGDGVSVSLIDKEYHITPIKAGQTEIKFSIGDISKSITINVNVSEYTSAHMDKDNYQIMQNDYAEFAVTYLPEYAFDKSKQIIIADTSIAKIVDNKIQYVHFGNTNVMFDNNAIADIVCVGQIDNIIFYEGSNYIQTLPNVTHTIKCGFVSQNEPIIVPILVEASDNIGIIKSDYVNGVYNLIFYINGTDDCSIVLTRNDIKIDIMSIDIDIKSELVESIDVEYESVVSYYDGMVFAPTISAYTNYDRTNNSLVTMYEKDNKCEVSNLEATIGVAGVYHFVIESENGISKEIELIVTSADVDADSITSTYEQFVDNLKNNKDICLLNDIAIINNDYIATTYSGHIYSFDQSSPCTIQMQYPIIDTFDGCIENVNILFPDMVGVEGCIVRENYGEIKNIGILNSSVTLTNNANLICYQNSNLISSVNIDCVIDANVYDFATICTINQGLIDSCKIDVDITGDRSISGITHYSDGSIPDKNPTISNTVIYIYVNYSSADSKYSCCGILNSALAVSSDTSATHLENIELHFDYDSSNISRIYVVAMDMAISTEINNCEIYVDAPSNYLYIIMAMKKLSVKYSDNNTLIFLQ